MFIDRCEIYKVQFKKETIYLKMSPSPDEREGTDSHDDQYAQDGPARDVGRARHPAHIGFLGE